eukprot:scaffold1333_cov274-Prasinococcus_capsulatus_cf.AAC.8
MGRTPGSCHAGGGWTRARSRSTGGVRDEHEHVLHVDVAVEVHVADLLLALAQGAVLHHRIDHHHDVEHVQLSILRITTTQAASAAAATNGLASTSLPWRAGACVGVENSPPQSRRSRAAGRAAAATAAAAAMAAATEEEAHRPRHSHSDNLHSSR